MEEATGFIGAFVVALIAAAIFYYGLGRRAPWSAFWIFLLIFFFTAWAGSIWMQPVGPLIWGFAFLPVLFLVILVGLILAAASGDRTTRRIDRATETEITETEVPAAGAGAAVALGIFFWTFIGLLIVAIIIGLLT